MNLPMELVGNVARSDYIRQATTTMTPTPGRRRRMPATLMVRVVHEVGHPSLVDAVRWNVPCSTHLQNVNARLWRHWLVGKTFKTVRHVSIAQCALRCRAILRTRTVPSSLRYFAVDFTCLLMLWPEILYNTRFSGYGFTTRLSVIRHRCGHGSGCSGVRQCIRHHS